MATPGVRDVGWQAARRPPLGRIDAGSVHLVGLAADRHLGPGVDGAILHISAKHTFGLETGGDKDADRRVGVVGAVAVKRAVRISGQEEVIGFLPVAALGLIPRGLRDLACPVEVAEVHVVAVLARFGQPVGHLRVVQRHLRMGVAVRDHGLAGVHLHDRVVGRDVFLGGALRDRVAPLEFAPVVVEALQGHSNGRHHYRTYYDGKNRDAFEVLELDADGVRTLVHDPGDHDPGLPVPISRADRIFGGALGQERMVVRDGDRDGFVERGAVRPEVHHGADSEELILWRSRLAHVEVTL